MTAIIQTRMVYLFISNKCVCVMYATLTCYLKPGNICLHPLHMFVCISFHIFSSHILVQELGKDLRQGEHFKGRPHRQSSFDRRIAFRQGVPGACSFALPQTPKFFPHQIQGTNKYQNIRRLQRQKRQEGKGVKEGSNSRGSIQIHISSQISSQ